MKPKDVRKKVATKRDSIKKNSLTPKDEVTIPDVTNESNLKEKPRKVSLKRDSIKRNSITPKDETIISDDEKNTSLKDISKKVSPKQQSIKKNSITPKDEIIVPDIKTDNLPKSMNGSDKRKSSLPKSEVNKTVFLYQINGFFFHSYFS